ncbi:Uma2 family endonuclease [Argonema galeatum]|uniref:Uma2 family endonuclease n=1 Tax=Argonema galeatum TaxID=2942762 RepID=UPI0020129865|nr:Uma2 family endonuclease [Argonema galeatum]MCL1467003.1 Uma2 family endonuclease [Argonema galeatum A003/A1]
MTATIQASSKRYYSPEEYLELESAAEYKNEYRDGEIVPMTGGTTNHNQIALNVSVALSIAFKQQDYRVFIGDVRLWITRKRFYTYPDVMVIYGKPEYFNERKDTITNPQVIMEVLSKSTKAYDRGDKFKAYKTIPTFQEYILIDQTKIQIEQYSKTANKRWLYREYDDEDTALVFNSLELEVSLLDVYEKVNFEETESEENGEA